MNNFNSCYGKIFVLMLIFIILPATTLAFDNSSNSTELHTEAMAINTQSEVYVSLSGDNDNNGTIDSPKLTLDGEKGAIKYANSKNINTIVLDNGVFNFEEVEINSSIYNLNSLTIKGSSSTIISAVNSNIFNIGVRNLSQKPMNITFMNIDFTNSNYFLPAISIFHSYVTIINCNFYGNGGSTSSVIGNFYNSTTKIIKSNFHDNIDEGSTGIIESSAGGYFGADYLNNYISIEDCNFYNNKASDAGVIFIIADSTIDIFVDIKNSNFTNNNVIGDGGAIFVTTMTVPNSKGSTTITINDSIFKNNTAKLSGGAIYFAGNSLLNITNSKFIDNHAGNELTISNSGGGGAIFAGAGSARIYESEFRKNTASRGGAIFNTMANDIIIMDSVFSLNNATIGGGVYMDLPRDYGQYSLFRNLTFDSNIATVGEAFYTNDLNEEEGRYEVFNCTFSNFKNNSIYNAGNLGLYDNKFLNSNIYNTGELFIKRNTYTNSSIKNNTKPTIITFLGNVTGYYGDTVKIQAMATNLFNNNFIVFNIGIYEYIAEYNKTTGLYEYNYKINTPNNAIVDGYSILDNNSSSNKVYVIVCKHPVNLTISIKDFYEDSNLNITVNLKSGDTLINASISVSIDNKNYNIFVRNGYGNNVFNNTSLTPGIHTAKASYGKNSFYYEYTNSSTTFIVYPQDIPIIDSLNGAIINISNSSGYYLSNVVLAATIYKDGKAVFYSNQLKFKINNQLVSASFDNISKQYNANYTFSQNKSQIITIFTNDSPIINQGVLTLLKNQTSLKLVVPDIVQGQSHLFAYITLTSNDKNISGNVALTINGKTYIVPIFEGSGYQEIIDIPVGNYTAFASFAQNDFYYQSNATVNFKVSINPKSTSIISNNIELYYKNGTRFSVTLVDCYNNPIANETIIIYINGVSNERITNKDGKASIAINLNPDSYAVSTEFAGSDKYDSCAVSNTVKVLSTIKGNNTQKIFKNNTQYYAQFLDNHGNPLVGAEVSFNINGVFYQRTTNPEGMAKLTINLKPDKYIITAKNSLNNQTFSNIVTVLSSIKGDDLIKYFQNKSQYVATFYNSDGSPLADAIVTFNINGVFYQRTTNKEGVAKMTINLRQGNYIITATNPINNQFYSNNVTILPVLVAEDLELHYKDGSKFIVKALDGNGRPAVNAFIQLNINGVIYDRITKEDGTASLTINLVQGVYIISTYWDNEVISNTVTVIQI